VPAAEGAHHVGLTKDGKYGFDGYLRKKTMYVNWAERP